MNTNDFEILLDSILTENNLQNRLQKDSLSKFALFYQKLIEVNAHTNLTAITEPDEVALKHFADCVTLAGIIPQNVTLIDVGCGGGFPSIPLAIVRPDLQIAALDSTAKKISFVKSVAELIGLYNVDAVCARAEDYVQTKRESYDVCVSRAVARLNILAELCLPFVKKNGMFYAMKSISAAEELEESESSIVKLGGAYKDSVKFELKYLDERVHRTILTFEKQSKTPSQYPRKFSQIKKNPL